MQVAVIGTGFVGVTSAVVYASFGNQVIGLDIEARKVASLNAGKVPFFEPKLADLLRQGLQNKNLAFTTSFKRAVATADVAMIAVGTPSKADGSVDLSALISCVKTLAPYLKEQAVLVIKSTVLPGTLEVVKKLVAKASKKAIHFASAPEFLKEGTAVDDTLSPDRVVLGVEDDFAYQVLDELHAPLKAPILRVRPESAQLAKYASNNYLALRIVYANVLAEICTQAGADIDEVLNIIGHEKRIGAHYWYPGLGYGGSCFPKDVKALAAYAQTFTKPEANFFAFIDRLNTKRPKQVLADLEKSFGSFKGKQLAILGLAFKPNTDDQRESPALTLIPPLLAAGAGVTTYDPLVKVIAASAIAKHQGYRQVTTIEDAVKNADLIVALIEWPQIIGFDFSKTKLKKSQFFFDVRNQFSPAKLQAAGYQYLSIGRKRRQPLACGWE